MREAAFGVTIPDPGVPLRTLELRVYRNERMIMEGIRVRDLTMTVRKVPLRRGVNRISMALANAGGEGPRSEEVTVVVDDQAPRIEIREPEDGSVINGSIVTRPRRHRPGPDAHHPEPVGRGGPDSGQRRPWRVHHGGAPGHRREPDRDRDHGRRRQSELGVVHRDPRGRGRLRAPRRLTHGAAHRVAAHEHQRASGRQDPEGQPVDGAPVVFVVSPPGLGTQVYNTVTVDGVARWDDVAIARDGAVKGNGLVAARVELGTGIAPASATKWLTHQVARAPSGPARRAGTGPRATPWHPTGARVGHRRGGPPRRTPPGVHRHAPGRSAARTGLACGARGPRSAV